MTLLQDKPLKIVHQVNVECYDLTFYIYIFFFVSFFSLFWNWTASLGSESTKTVAFLSLFWPIEQLYYLTSYTDGLTLHLVGLNYVSWNLLSTTVNLLQFKEYSYKPYCQTISVISSCKLICGIAVNFFSLGLLTFP